MSEAEIAAHQARVKAGRNRTPLPLTRDPLYNKPVKEPAGRAKLGGHKSGQMNKLEAAYARHIDAEILAGEVIAYRFEFASFKLAQGVHYRSDFLVELRDGSIQERQVKGFMTEGGRVKLRMFAKMSLWPVYLVQRIKGNWVIEQVIG
jgi:hypothetical protein